MFLLGHNTKTEISRADSQPANRHSEMPARDRATKTEPCDARDVSVAVLDKMARELLPEGDS